MDPDMNKYDLNHACAPHPLMSRAEWERVYRTAWDTYYSAEHMETVLAPRSRDQRQRVHVHELVQGLDPIEKVHPLEGGFLRLKFRRDRRPGLPILPRWKFYPHYAGETIVKLTRWFTIYWALHRSYARIQRDPHKLEYMDLALTPVTDHDVDDLEMFHTPSAPAFVAQEQRRQSRQAAAVA